MGGHTLPKSRRATAEAPEIRGRRPKRRPERGGLPDARMISDRYTPVPRPRRAGREDGQRWMMTTTTTTKTFELAEGGYSCASRRGGWIRTAITDLEERRDPRASFGDGSPSNSRGVAMRHSSRLRKMTLVRGGATTMTMTTMTMMASWIRMRSTLTVQMPPPRSVLINVHVCLAHATTASEAV